MFRASPPRPAELRPGVYRRAVPQAGRILVDGVPLTDIHLRTLHRKTAIVAQDTQLFATRYFYACSPPGICVFWSVICLARFTPRPPLPPFDFGSAP